MPCSLGPRDEGGPGGGEAPPLTPGNHSESSQSTVLPSKISTISLGFSAAGKPRQRHSGPAGRVRGS